MELHVDAWIWLMDRSSNFTVKSAYKFLLGRSGGELIGDCKKLMLRSLWSTAAPAKFLVHAWGVLLDNLPTCVALQQRGVISFNQGSSCVFCFRYHEDIGHLFFLFSMSSQLYHEDNGTFPHPLLVLWHSLLLKCVKLISFIKFYLLHGEKKYI